MACGTVLDFVFYLYTHAGPIKGFLALCLHLTIQRCVPCIISSMAGLIDEGTMILIPQEITPSIGRCCVGLVALFLANRLESWCTAHGGHLLCFVGVLHTLVQKLRFFPKCSLLLPVVLHLDLLG